ncbi:MAG TPA: hypothetical protein VMF33_03375 [Acidimicrobiales bacterium]|nr:hypothetical protein [Acidimicrobiales bacterium]
MLFFLLRVLLVPLAVVTGTVAQRRFGDAVGGLVIGLPLASLPLLWLIALQHGTGFVASMTSALLVGSVAEAVVLWLYAHFTVRFSPSTALGGALGVFALAACTIDALELSAILAGVVTAVGFALALRWWPETTGAVGGPTGHSRLWLRVVVATVFTIVIASLAGRLGPVLSGLIDALPATSLMMAFLTHQEHGSHASSHFLYGVTRGSFSYLASMIVLAELLGTRNLPLAFGAAMLVALLVQGLFQAYDAWKKRVTPVAPTTEDLSSPGTARAMVV